ncbi:MAG: PrsW family intramembrane metalloprotease [Chitinophagales bacterium]
MLLFALAIAPGIAISLFVYSRDRFEREPMRLLILSFVLGMLSTLPPLALQLLAGDIRTESGIHSILNYALYSFVIIAFTEEGSKFLVLRLFAYPKKSFNEPFDGIVYAVMISMGFATVENIEYVERFGIQTGIVRFFLSVPAHASFAVLTGYYAGLAKANPEKSSSLLWKGLIIAVFFHGSFDFFIFLQKNQKITAYISEGLLSFGAFATFYIAMRLALKTIRMHDGKQGGSGRTMHEEENPE